MVELKDTLLMPNTKFPMRGNLPNKRARVPTTLGRNGLIQQNFRKKMLGNLHMYFTMDLHMRMVTSTLDTH